MPSQDSIEKKAQDDNAADVISKDDDLKDVISDTREKDLINQETTTKIQEEKEQEMIIHFNTVIDEVFKHEGGYVNDPADPGGETNLGISKRYFPNEDIKGMTVQRARQIYNDVFWRGNNIDALPHHLRYIVFDAAINMGSRTAILMLQKLVGVAQDGIIGNITAKAASRLPIQVYANARKNRYNLIIARNNKLAKFRKGWFKRVDDVVNFTNRYYQTLMN